MENNKQIHIPLNIIIVILFLIVGAFFSVHSASASVLMEDHFENGLSNWTIPITDGVSTTLDMDTGSSHNNVLKIDYGGTNQWLDIYKDIPQNISNVTNVVYGIDFWDDKTRNYGTGFYIMDDADRYIEFVVDGNNYDNYVLRNGTTTFDTGIERTNGWHNIQIYVTKAGSYLSIDGQSLTYLRAKLFGGEDPSKFPINNQLIHATKVGIEYPSWNKPVSVGYWDNFTISEFRTDSKTTSQKEEDLLIEFVNRYDGNYSFFQNPPNSLKGIQNFQLARLGLAAAYGVRASKTGNSDDLVKMNALLQATYDDFPRWRIENAVESPIAGQALASLLAWKLNDSHIDATLKENIKNNILPQIAQDIINNMNGGWADPSTTLDVAGDGTQAEQHAWMASYLGFVSNLLKSNVNSGLWWKDAKILACNSTSSSTTNSVYSCEVSQVLTPTFLFKNHGMINPSYSLTIPWGLSQATLYPLNANKPLSVEFTKNIRELYDANIAPLVRTQNYTYKAYSPVDKLLLYTARDDWGQDATLQDNGWAYLDKVLNLHTLDGVVNYAWLTRGGGTVYPSDIVGLSDWISNTSMDCGDGTNCLIYADNNGRNFFLNGMDAIDRFMALFIIDPSNYKLQPTFKPADLNGDGKVNIYDYNKLVTSYNDIYTTSDYTSLIEGFKE